MKKLFYASFTYIIVGLASGLFYREFTKANDYTAADGFTQLSVVHTHLLVLGVIVLLIAMLAEKAFALSESKLFGWFFWIYNAGLILTTGAMTANGVLHVLGEDTGKALAGIAGSGHIIMAIGLILFFLALRSRAFGRQRQQEPAAVADESSLSVG